MIIAVATNPFDRYKGIGKPEEKKEMKIEPSALEEVLKEYEAESEKGLPPIEYHMDVLLKNRFKHVLRPEDIGIFLQFLTRFEERNDYNPEFAGKLVSRLIQNSYEAGHNNFLLNTSTLTRRLKKLGSVSGTKERPLILQVTGESGAEFGWSAKFANFKIIGNTDGGSGMYAKNSAFHIEGTAGALLGANATDSTFYARGAGRACGSHSERCKFEIRGNVDYDCGHNTKQSEFIIEGNAGDEFGSSAEQSRFTIHGEVKAPSAEWSLHTTFTVYDRISYEIIKEGVMRPGYGKLGIHIILKQHGTEKTLDEYKL